jgi:hypothetical protein
MLDDGEQRQERRHSNGEINREWTTLVLQLALASEWLSVRSVYQSHKYHPPTLSPPTAHGSS